MSRTKTISILLCLCLLLSAAAPVMAASAEDYSSLKLGSFTQGQYYVSAPPRLTILLAGYHNGRLLYSAFVEKNETSNAAAVNRFFSLPSSDADVLKVFFLDDMFAPLGVIVTTPAQLPQPTGEQTPSIIL